MHPVTEYAHKVRTGEIVAGPYVRGACERHFRDLEDPRFIFNEKAANRVYNFFERYLTLSDGQFEGAPFKLHIVQKFLLGSMFGWFYTDSMLSPAGPKRRFRRAYIEMGKGNGKSPLIGGLGLFGMLADGEKGAQIYSAAADRAQAEILFQDAVKMAKRSKDFEDIVQYYGNQKVYNMYCMLPEQAGSFFRPTARTIATTGSGIRPHFALCDEVHEHPNRNVIDFLERGFKFRRNPFLVMITNSGSDRTSICWEEHEHATKVAMGDVDDPETFAYVCAMDDEDDPINDPSVWIKANPLLGSVITEDYLAKIAKQARDMPGKQNLIRRLHFCEWTDATTAWISRKLYESREDPAMEMIDFDGQAAVVGLDLSQRKDITAKAVVFHDGFKEQDDWEAPRPCFAAFVHGYTPQDTLRIRAETDKAPYDQWVDEGFLTATPGSVVRFSHVIKDIKDLEENYDLLAVAYDAWMITRFKEDCDEMNVTLPLVEHPQGWNKRKVKVDENSDVDVVNPLWMPGSVDLLENLFLESRIRVHVNPFLRSSVAGATFVESPAGLKRFDKAKATQRIDGCVALAMAVGAAEQYLGTGLTNGGDALIGYYERLGQQAGGGETNRRTFI